MIQSQIAHVAKLPGADGTDPDGNGADGDPGSRDCLTYPEFWT